MNETLQIPQHPVAKVMATAESKRSKRKSFDVRECPAAVRPRPSSPPTPGAVSSSEAPSQSPPSVGRRLTNEP